MAEPRRSADQDLERALRNLAGRIDYPSSPDLAPAVRRRLEHRPSRRRLPAVGRLTPSWRRAAAAALVILLLIAAALASSPGLRDAVAQRLGLRGIVITTAPTPTVAPTTTVVVPGGEATARAATPTPSPLPSPTASPVTLNLGTPDTLGDAVAQVPFPILVPDLPGLNAPDAVYVDKRAGAPVVTLAYRPRPGFPAAGTTGVTLLLTEFQGQVDQPFLQKGLEPGTRVTPVTVGGEPGYWIDGQLHQLVYLDPQGQAQVDTARLAGNTLVWTHGDLTLRLESQLSEEDALKVGASLRPVSNSTSR